MTKTNTKFTEALALLLVIALAPASVAFAQTTATEPSTSTTDTTGTDTTDKTTDTRTDEQKRKDRLQDDLKKVREGIADRKLKERAADKIKDRSVDKIRDANVDKIRDKVTDRVRDGVVDKVRDKRIDKAPDLTYSGKTNGWAILGGMAFPSSIGLSGEAYHQGGGNWIMTAVGDIAVADQTAKLDLKGHVRGDQITLKGTGTLNDGTAINIHLKGHYAPTSNTNEFAIAFTNSAIQYKDTGARMPLMQVGTVTITPIVTPEPIPVPVEPVPVPITPAQ
jgi:hypothetical protein